MKNAHVVAILSILTLFAACADHPGKWVALDLQRSNPPVISEEAPAKPEEVAPELPIVPVDANEPPVKVVRGKLDFVKKAVESTPESFRITGTLRKDMAADREVVFEGRPNPEAGVVELYEVTEGERPEKAAAMMYCLGQGTDGNFSCDNFYMNLYVNDEENKTVYGDQFIVRPEAQIERPNPTTELPEINPLKPETPEIEIPEVPYLERKEFHDEPKRLRNLGYPVEEQVELVTLNLLPKKKTGSPTQPVTPPSSSTTTSTTTTSTTSTSTTTTTTQIRPIPAPPKPVPTPTPPPKPTPAKPVTPSTTTTSTTSTTTTTTTLPAKPAPAPVTPQPPKAPAAPTEQSIGSHSEGWLNNPTNLLDLSNQPDSHFKILWPFQNWHFGTKEMGQFLVALGKAVAEILPGGTLHVGQVSDINGGESGHGSHETGLDADISYLVSKDELIFKNVTTRTGIRDGLLIKENWELMKKAFATKMVAGIFISSNVRNALCKHAVETGELVDAQDRGEAYQVLRRMSFEPHHYDHFHVRLKCPEKAKRCLIADPGTEVVDCFAPKQDPAAPAKK